MEDNPDYRPHEVERYPVDLPRQHPRPGILDIRCEFTSIKEFFGEEPPFNERTVLRFAEYVRGYYPDHQPTHVMDRGGLALYIWIDRMPTPATHLQQTFLRLPFLEEVENLSRFVLRHARAQNEHLEGERTNRCSVCGSHLLGMPLADHSYIRCPLDALEGERRLEFLAINHAAFCSKCNSRFAKHTGCTGPVCHSCDQRGHTAATRLCDSRLGRLTPESQQELLTVVTQHRRNYLLHIRNLTNDINKPLRYRSYTDQAYIFLERRVEDRWLIDGWGFYHDDAGEFPQPAMQRYSNHPHRSVRYKGLVPPEYHSQAVNPIPTFPPHEVEYLQAVHEVIIEFHRSGEVIGKSVD